MLSRKELKVSGNDLIALGIPPGPKVGVLLKRLLDAVINGKIPNEKEALLNLAKQTLHEPSG